MVLLYNYEVVNLLNIPNFMVAVDMVKLFS